MTSAWDLDLTPDPRPRDPFRAVVAHPIKQDQLREWPRYEPDPAPRRFNTQSLCFELPPRVKFEAQTMFKFVHASTGRVLRRFNAETLDEATQEKSAWCGRVGRFAGSVDVVSE